MKEIEISPEGIEELLIFYRNEKDKRIADRIQCIRLRAMGYKYKEISGLLGISFDTIATWIKIFHERGIRYLCEMRYEGDKGDLIDEEIKRLKEHLSETIYRSAKAVREYIEKEFGKSYTESGIYKLLKRLGFSYKKPKLVSNKANAEAQSIFFRGL